MAYIIKEETNRNFDGQSMTDCQENAVNIGEKYWQSCLVDLVPASQLQDHNHFTSRVTLGKSFI
jgi:hypothetical protein